MPRKKVDERVRILIENGVKTRTRSFFVLVGDRGKDQVVNLHYILSKAQVKARPSVLWCYNKELGFSTHRQKRMKAIKKLQAKGVYDADRDDPFELFISSTNIRWCYYKETQRILGSTYGMVVLQDFEAITPNILCRTIETVEGGGIVVLLLRTMSSLRQLYGLTMDVHSRFRTEAHGDVVGRFNERFLLSLSNCPTCLVLDDELNVLPLSRHAKHITPVAIADLAANGAAGKEDKKEEKKAKGFTGFSMADEMLAAAGVNFSNTSSSATGRSVTAQSAAQAGRALTATELELEELKASLNGTPLVGALAACTRTLDQAKAVMTFAEAISEKTLASTVALTAGRGRGKSSALGLAIAAAVGYGYSNIFVTAPSPENLKTLFEFVFKGLEALSYKEHTDYEAVASTNPEWGGAIVRVNIFRGHRQTVAYISPADAEKLTQAELLVVDEAAAIPLPVVKRLLGPYLVFLASTINGYEGTGRALSLKLVQQLRASAVTGGAASAPAGAGASSGAGAAAGNTGPFHGRSFREVSLKEPIRYAPGDGVEAWLNELLCLDAVDPPRLGGGAGRLPAPTECELYAVDRDALFSGHKISEGFLKRVWGLYVSSHYKNSPNDLQLLSDAPAHRLFVLLGPQDSNRGGGAGGSEEGPKLPDVLVVLQVCLEGKISRESIRAQLARGARSSGDLIPWTVSQQFQDEGFAALSGARVVRIATHPDAARMGYGSRAIELLCQYYEGKLASVPDASNNDSDDEAEEVAVDRGLRQEDKDDKKDKDAGEDEDMAGGDGEDVPKDKLHTEKLKPRKALPPLLVPAGDITRPERLHWLGVSYGLTQSLFSFWHRGGYLPVYLRQTANDLTAEHTMIMLRALDCAGVPGAPKAGWAKGFVADFARRFLSLLGAEFRTYDLPLALSVADAACSVLGVSSAAGGAAGDDEDDAGASSAPSAKRARNGGASDGAASSSADGSTSRAGASGSLTSRELSLLFTPHDLGRLDAYARNLVDYHLILDLVPDAARLYFTGRLAGVRLPRLQAGILLAVGLQRCDVDTVAAGLNVPGGQVLALFNKTVRKISTALAGVMEKDVHARLDAEAEEAQRALEASKKGLGTSAAAAAGASSSSSKAKPAKEDKQSKDKGSSGKDKESKKASKARLDRGSDDDEDMDEGRDGVDAYHREDEAQDRDDDDGSSASSSDSGSEDDGAPAKRAKSSSAVAPGVASLLTDPGIARYAVPQGGVIEDALNGMVARAKGHDRAGALQGAHNIPKTLSVPRQAAAEAPSSHSKSGKKDKDKHRSSSGQGKGGDDGPRSHPDGIFGGAVDKMAAGAKKLRRD